MNIIIMNPLKLDTNDQLRFRESFCCMEIIKKPPVPPVPPVLTKTHLLCGCWYVAVVIVVAAAAGVVVLVVAVGVLLSSLLLLLPLVLSFWLWL